MTTLTKSIVALVGAVIVGVAIYGGYLYPRISPLAGSTVGTTFNVAKYAGVVIDLSSNSGATSTSILNTDAGNRYVIASKIICPNMGNSFTAYTGAGLTSNGLQVTVGTSSTASPAAVASVGATAKVANAFAVGTTTGVGFIASSTLVTGAPPAAIWHAGEYMTFWWNATNTPATGSTAPCTEGVEYLGS